MLTLFSFNRVGIAPRFTVLRVLKKVSGMFNRFLICLATSEEQSPVAARCCVSWPPIIGVRSSFIGLTKPDGAG